MLFRVLAMIMATCLMVSGCLSEPDGLVCPQGKQLRLADTRWICDFDNKVADIPQTRNHYYVDATNGNDSNSGTIEYPWKTIVKAAATVTAGSTVLIRSGIYDDGPIHIANSGSAENPIVFKADGFSQATIINNGIQAIGKSHLTIANLRFEKIRGFNGNAIRIEGRESQLHPPASHILLLGNTIIDTWSSGIAVWGVRYRKDPGNYQNISHVTIESNTLELNTNGGANEIITVANGASEVAVRYNTIREGDFNDDGTPDGTGDEGIDFKEGVTNSVITGNALYGLSDKAIYIDGGRGENEADVAVNQPVVSGIEISNNRIRDNWGGIAVTTEGRGKVGEIAIYNNVISNINKDGILIWYHPFGQQAGGLVDNVWIFNNTITQSGHLTPAGRKSWGGIRSSHPTANVLVENNIAWDNHGFDINNSLTNTSNPAVNTLVRGNNLCREMLCDVNNVPAITEDATPTAGSPALDSGSDAAAPDWLKQLPSNATKDICGVSRDQGMRRDMGAVETPFVNNTARPYLLSYCITP